MIKGQAKQLGKGLRVCMPGTHYHPGARLVLQVEESLAVVGFKFSVITHLFSRNLVFSVTQTFLHQDFGTCFEKAK